MDFQCRREDQWASLGNKVHCPQGQSVGSWCLSHCRSDSTSARALYQPHLSQKLCHNCDTKLLAAKIDFLEGLLLFILRNRSKTKMCSKNQTLTAASTNSL